MASTVIRYIRGNEYVQNVIVEKPGKPINPKSMNKVGDTAHGLVGELWVHNLCFQTIERMDRAVRMPKDAQCLSSKMFWSDHYGSYIIDPSGVQKNILIHPVTYASEVEGCVGVGFLEPSNAQQHGTLSLSKASLSLIWEHCGGKPGKEGKGQILEVALYVEGDMPRFASCKPWKPD